MSQKSRHTTPGVGLTAFRPRIVESAFESMKTPKTIINIKPFGKFNRWVGLLGGIMAVCCVTIAHAQYSNAVVGATLIYSNGFDGLGTVNITNTPADQEFAIYGGPSVTTNWVDLSGSSDTNAFYANGTVGTMQASSIVLPFTPQSNHVYALRASVTLAGAPGTWVAAGYDFYSKIQGSSHNLFNGNGGWNWALINYSGNVEYFLGQSGANGIYNATAFTSAANLTHVLTLILDTTFNENSSNRWIVSGYVDAVPMGTKIFPSNNPSIAGLGYGQNGTMSAPQNIKWNYFTLSANQELIIQQPASANVNQGSAFTNSVLVGGTPPFFYQWCTNGVAIGGATNANLVINPVLASSASSNYTVVVTNSAYGAVTSSPAALSVNTVPAFSTADPITYTNVMTLFAGTNVDGTNYLGSSPSFSVSATGKLPITYQWLTNGVAVGGATNTSFTFANCQWGSPTSFACIASNSLGTATNTWGVQFIPAPVAPYPQVVLALGPVGYWRLNEIDDDPINQENNGEICNDFMSGNNGLYTNTALYFSPGYSTTTDPNENSPDFGPPDPLPSEAFGVGTNVDFSASSNAEFTVSVWANGGFQGTIGSEPGNSGLVAKGGYGTEEFALDDGAPGACARFMVRNASGALSSAGSTLQLGGNDTWYHLVGVCDESNGVVSFYVNGLLAGQATIPKGSGVLPDASVPITIGADAGGQFNGGLNDTAIFSSALSAGQVAELYESVGGTIPVSFVAPLPPTNWVYQTGGTLTVSATAFGTPPIGYYWTNTTVGGVLASGTTNATANLNATLTIPNAPASLSGDVLELVVTNSLGSTNWFVNLVAIPPAVTLSYTDGILYSNSFDGGTWTIAGMPATAANSLVGGTNTTWIDVLGTNDTGSMPANGIDNCTLGNSWIVPFTPHSGYIYTEIASLAFNGNPGNWVGMGFAQNLSSNTTSARFDDAGPDGVDWIILSENTGNVQYFAGPGGIPTAGLTNQNNFFTSGAGTHTVQVVLDTTQPQWVQYAFVDGVPAGTNTYTSNPTIAAAGITQNVMGSPNNVQWDYFALTAVSPNGFPPYLLPPPPSTNSILLTNATVTIPATGYGTGPWGYYWSNNSTVLASGATNNTAPNNANLSVPTSSLSAGQLELVLTNALGTNITLITLVSPVNPNPTNIVATVTNNDLYLTWPVDHAGWQLQAQTNSLGVGLSTNWANYNPSTGTNQVVVPINLTNGAVFYRLTYTP